MQDETPQLYSWQVLWDKLPAGTTCLVRNDGERGDWYVGIQIANAERNPFVGWQQSDSGRHWKHVPGVERVLAVSPARFSHALIIWKPGCSPSPVPMNSAAWDRESWFNSLQVGDRVYAEWESHKGNGEITRIDSKNNDEYRYKVLIYGEDVSLWIKNDKIEPPCPEPAQSSVLQGLSVKASGAAESLRIREGLERGLNAFMKGPRMLGKTALLDFQLKPFIIGETPKLESLVSRQRRLLQNL